MPQKLISSIDANHLGVQLAGKHVHHHVAFIKPQQAMIDKNAGKLVANGAVNQGSRHRRVHAARQAKNDFLITHLLAYFFDRLADVIPHDPVRPRAADVEHKALEDSRALTGMRDLGVKLHTIKMTSFVSNAGDRAAVGGGHQLETRRHFGHLVAVAHPDRQHALPFIGGEIGNILEQRGMATGTHIGVTKLALVAAFHLTA